MNDIIDTTIHPYDTNAILYWMIGRWDAHPDRSLLVITEHGDELVNRLRVQLARVRRTAKANSGGRIQQFGFNSVVINWDSKEAVCLTRFVTSTQRYSMIFSKLEG